MLARNRAWPRTFYGLITGFLEREETPERCVVREVKEELDLDAGTPTLVGVYAFERMNQVIIAYHVTATGTITLNEELDDYKHVPFERCRVWPGGTGLALRDWLRTKGYEPEILPAALNRLQRRVDPIHRIQVVALVPRRVAAIEEVEARRRVARELRILAQPLLEFLAAAPDPSSASARPRPPRRTLPCTPCARTPC